MQGTNVIMIRGDVDPYKSLQYYIAPPATVNQYLVPGLFNLIIFDTGQN